MSLPKAAARALPIAVLCGGLVLLAACGSDQSGPTASLGDAITVVPSSTATSQGATTLVPGTAATPDRPPCDVDAIKDGVSAAGLQLTEQQQFECEGNWAYAFVTTGTGGPSTVAVLQGNGPRWAVVPTSVACSGIAMPASLRQSVCGITSSS